MTRRRTNAAQRSLGSSSLLSKLTTTFPKARYFAVMGELAESYGGTSNVLFHRSNIIADNIREPFSILTFGHLRDYTALDQQMHADGRLSKYVHFRNMWDELSHISAPRGNEYDIGDTFAPIAPGEATETIRGHGVPIRRFRKDEAGRTLQVDMLRADGTVIVSDRRDLPKHRSQGAQSLVLCDATSQPIREFNSLHELRRFWLDFVIADSKAIVFSDSFRIARTMHAYRRPNVTVIQTFHNNHIEKDRTGAFGYTKRDYMTFFRNIDSFDATVFLSSWQLKEVDELMGRGRSRWVVPNSRPVASDATGESPRRSSGVMVGRLVAGKQCDHAIEAVVLANSQMSESVTLDIYGEGPDRERLQTKICALDASTVTLRGYSSATSDAFAQSAFSVLSSRTEAFPLVLIESLSHGCIPICYDIRYGPRDIITDGKDGFLVQPGDIRGIASAISRIQSMPEEEFDQMRTNAFNKARAFSDNAALKRWSKVLRKTVKAKQAPQKLALKDPSSVIRAEQTGIGLTAQFLTNRDLDSGRAFLIVAGRSLPAIMRLECDLIQTGKAKFQSSVFLDRNHIAWANQDTLDLSLEVSDNAGRSTIRFPADGSSYTLGQQTAYPTSYGNLSIKP